MQTWTFAVNFINILQAAFTCADSKRAKKTDSLTVFFVRLGSASVKAVYRSLMKLTLGYNETKGNYLAFTKSLMKETLN